MGKVEKVKKHIAKARVAMRKVGNKALVYRGRLEKSMERTEALVGVPSPDEMLDSLNEWLGDGPRKTKRKED